MATAVGKGGETNPFRTSFVGGHLSDVPLVLWTDGLSASASEVLAGEIVDMYYSSVH